MMNTLFLGAFWFQKQLKIACHICYSVGVLVQTQPDCANVLQPNSLALPLQGAL